MLLIKNLLCKSCSKTLKFQNLKEGEDQSTDTLCPSLIVLHCIAYTSATGTGERKWEIFSANNLYCNGQSHYTGYQGGRSHYKGHPGVDHITEATKGVDHTTEATKGVDILHWPPRESITLHRPPHFPKETNVLFLSLLYNKIFTSYDLIHSFRDVVLV